jgi:hypothetical protein
MQAANYALEELNKETTIGELGMETSREVRKIDMSDFDRRKTEIADKLWAASTNPASSN